MALQNTPTVAHTSEEKNNLNRMVNPLENNTPVTKSSEGTNHTIDLRKQSPLVVAKVSKEKAKTAITEAS